MGSLHSGIQQTHFTESNNLASKATALYNDASDLIMQDTLTWNSILDYFLDAEAATQEGDDLKRQVAEAKIDVLMEE